jgi:hypothetical protein
VQIERELASRARPALAVDADLAGPRPKSADGVQERRLDVLTGDERELRLRTGLPRGRDQVLALGDEEAGALAIAAPRQPADRLQLLVVG